MRQTKTRRALALVALTTAAVLALAGSAAAKKQGPVISVASTPAQVSGHLSLASQTATCPKGTRATGGGFSATPTSAAVSFFVFQSRKLGQTAWQVSAQVVDTVGPADVVSLTTFVYCRKNAPKTTAVAETVQNAPNEVGPLAIPTCTKGRKAFAGGFSTPPPGRASGANAALVTDSFRVGTETWLTQVTSGPTSPGSLATGYVYCAKKQQGQGVPRPVKVTSPGNATFGGLVTATAPCRGNIGPVAGGFSQTGISPTNAVYPFQSARVGTTWRAAGSHNGFPIVPSTISALAYCG
jgi:hypothetical protein